MNNIPLNDFLRLSPEEMLKYKLHLASKNDQGTEPLDEFARSFDDWVYWNEWRGNKDDFTRQFIFSFIKDYHHNYQNKYIFGGIFEVLGRHQDREYDIKLCDYLKPFIGRMVVVLNRPKPRGRAFYLEKFMEDLYLSEILEKAYEGVEFPGYDSVLIDFPTLEVLVSNQKTDWRVALQNQKGIYLIADKKTGKKYVGSAYGDYGIWARWCCYADTAHGGNDALVDLIEKEGTEYARDNFQLSILEVWPMKTDDETIIYRESFWKDVLLTRGEFGYNKN